MGTIRETVRETIKNYTDEYLEQMINDRKFIGFETDGEIRKIDYDRFAGEYDANADDMREAMIDILDWFEDGFFDDEDGDALMAEIVNNDVIWEWGADATLLENYDQKIVLLEYVKDYGVTEHTKDNMDEYEWESMTRRLDLNRRFDGKIYSTCKWNSENMTFCLDWDAPEDCLQAGAIDIYETGELKENIEDGDVLFWSADKGEAVTDEAARAAALEWLESHDVTERRKSSTSEAYWKELTSKLGLPEDYNESIYYTDNGCSWNSENVMLLTVLPSKTNTYKFGIALTNDLTTEHKEFETDEQAEEYGWTILERDDVVSLQIYKEMQRGYLYLTTLVK